ncbi:hypothetical protein PENTCL1PPCAC_24441, partial [Pristionchus entomophagus]
MIPRDGLSKKEEQGIEVEAELLSKMKHPMIIGYYDHFKCEDSLAIVMLFAEGGTLENLIRDQQNDHFAEGTVLKYFTQILHGLDYIHSLGIIHRDLKTANILLNKKKTIIKLADFGISKQLAKRSIASTLIGTTSYMSPEIIGGRPYTIKSDIWALGCVLYEMFMLLKVGFSIHKKTYVAYLFQNRYAPLGDHVSKESRDIVSKCLSDKQDQRPTAKVILTRPKILPYTLLATTDTGRIMG